MNQRVVNIIENSNPKLYRNKVRLHIYLKTNGRMDDYLFCETPLPRN